MVGLFICFIFNNYNSIKLKFYAYTSTNIETWKFIQRDGHISKNNALKIVAGQLLKNSRREEVSMKQFFKDENITSVSIKLIENNSPEKNESLSYLMGLESSGTYWQVVIHAVYIDTYFNVSYYTGEVLLQKTLEWVT